MLVGLVIFLLACSPHPRGWSQLPAREELVCPLLPAPAGMVPSAASRTTRSRSAPRTRGDGPHTRPHSRSVSSCSPHPRGWSLEQQREQKPDDLLPAPAGMVPQTKRSGPVACSAPRTRGDGPQATAIAAMTPSCSPHPRGWSHRHGRRRPRPHLLPAPAGMVPSRLRRPPGRSSAPRTRGDGPSVIGPASDRGLCSPHPRGWSRLGLVHARLPLLLPAPAGMVPSPRSCGRWATAAPRTRGDGPACARSSPAWLPCSPHPRGWSRMGVERNTLDALLPAPAGMVPPCPSTTTRLAAAPRTRGWSRWEGESVRVLDLLPAPAGMVPQSLSGSSSWTTSTGI